jgi:hypothetical protein
MSWSYFFYDFLSCVYYGICDKNLVIHHGLCVLGYAVMELEGYGGTEVLSNYFIFNFFIYKK